MSRQTFAGAMIALNRENLDAWVRDPQSTKPGCLMPAFGLADERRQLIVDYLLTLR
jgi:cytochrome c1